METLALAILPSSMLIRLTHLHTIKTVSQSDRLMNCESESAIWQSSRKVVNELRGMW